MRKKFSILIVPESGGKTRNYTISQLGARILGGIFICILGGTIWLIFEYGNILQKTLTIKALKFENRELRNKYKKLKVFEHEFADFKLKTLKIANMLGVKHTLKSSQTPLSVTFSSRDSVPNIKSSVKFGKELKTLVEEEKNKLIPSTRPVEGWITQKFSPSHRGVDFAAKLGTPVISTIDGTVEFAGWDKALGQVIEITNNKRFKTVYGHLARKSVEKGDKIKCGDLIGFVGSTGESSAPHLHYEVWLNGVPQNPEHYLIK